MQFLHLSDIHINAGFSNKSESVRIHLRESIKHSFVKAITYVIENDLEGVILAGDLFDHDKISFKDELFISDLFLGLLNKGYKIFYTSGNHDPLNTIVFNQEILSHELFYYFSDDTVKHLELISKNEQRYHVVGIGHRSKNEKRNLIKTFPKKNTREPWIGIAHASVPSALTTADKESYMAVALYEIESLQYDYFALGHIHLRQKLSERIAYSGDIQGINIKETGLKGGLLIQVNENGTLIENVDFCSIIWEQLNIILEDEQSTLERMKDFLLSELMKAIEQSTFAAKNMIFRLILQGKTPLKNQLEIDENLIYLSEVLKAKSGVLDLEIKLGQIQSDYPLEVILTENTVLTEIINNIQKSDYDAELYSKLVQLPIYEKCLNEGAKFEYLKSLQNLLTDEIVQRMVVDKNEN